MGITGEAVLEGAGDWVPDACKPMAGEGNGFQFVPNIACDWVKFDEETLVTSLDMHFGGRVDVTNMDGRVNGFGDAAEIECAEPERADFDGNDLADCESCVWIGNARPAQIEVGPFLERTFCHVEHGFAIAEERA